MDNIYLLLLFGHLCLQSAAVSNCYQEMNYEKLYGYKYDINCNNLNANNLKELEQIIVTTYVKLTITNSNLSIITSKFFKNMPNTQQLVINSSIISLDGQLFTHLDHLDSLALSNNSIHKLPQGFLGGLNSVRVLKLNYNMLNFLPNNTFLETDLKELDLSFNNFTDFRISCELQQLTRLQLSHNQIENFQNFSLDCFPLLQDLSLSQNKIISLKPLKKLRYLKKLDLSNNFIQHVDSSFTSMEQLKELNLEGNLLQNILDGSFRNTPQLTSLNLGRNSLTDLSLPNFNYLKTLILDVNKLKKVPLLNLTSLTKLSLSHNGLNLNNSFRTYPHLVELRLSHCKIGEIQNQINNLKFLEILDMSYSDVGLREFSFQNFNKLKEVDLSGNFLTSLRRLGLPNLKKLNLSRNAFEELELDLFADCYKMAVLDLSYNQLEVLYENVLNPLESLSELNLEHNKLKFLSYEGVVSNLKNLRTFNIEGNMFSCQFLSEMVHYLTSNKVEYGFKEQIGDYNENVAGIHCHENNIPDSQNPLSLIIVLVGLVIISFIAFVLCRILVLLRKKENVDQIELLERRIRLKNYL